MKKLKHITIWILLNGLAGWLVYAVIFTSLQQNAGLVRLAQFALWAWAMLAILIAPLMLIYSAVMKPSEVKVADAPVRFVPAWISHGYDILIVAALVYGGWIWTAIIWLLHIFAQAVALACSESINKKQREFNAQEKAKAKA